VIKDLHCTIEVACFLRLTLLRLTDRASRFSNVDDARSLDRLVALKS
jgi:hypothetical protein